MMGAVRRPPSSTKDSLKWRLHQHARHHWPGLAAVQVRFRSSFAYVDGRLPDGEVVKLNRLRYVGSATTWGFAIYRYSHDDDNVLPAGMPSGRARTPSTARAASTSARPHRRQIHRRTNARHH